MKHIIAMTAAAGLVIAAGCGGPPEDERADDAAPPRAGAFRVAVPDFLPFGTAVRREWEAVGKSSGSSLKLEVVPLGYNDLYEELFNRGGLAEGRFDAVLLHSDWVAKAHAAEALADLAPELRKSPPDDYPGAWSDDLLAAGRLDEQVLGLPYHDGLLCLVYRRDMLDSELLRRVHEAKFGYPMKPPASWEDLARLATFLHRPEEEVYGMALPAEAGGPGPFWVLSAAVRSRGGRLIGDEGLKLDTQEARKSLAAYRQLVGDRFAVHRAVREMDIFDAGRTFAEGGLAMAVAPVGFAALAEAGPASKVPGHVGVAPLPHGPEQPPLTLAACWVLAVPKTAPNRGLSYRFVKHCAGEEADKARTLAGVLGTRKSTWADEEVRAVVPPAAELESLHAAAEALHQRPDLPALAEKANRAVIAALDAGGRPGGANP